MTPPTSLVRPATPADARAMQDVVQAVYLEYGFTWDPVGYHRDLFEFEETYLGDGAGFWVAEHNGAVVGGGGFVSYPPNPPHHLPLVMGDEGQLVIPEADCEVCRLYLLSSARGLGLGRALMTSIIKGARSAGCRLMEIWSDKMFAEAHALYGKVGALPVGDRIDASPDRAEEWGFKLHL